MELDYEYGPLARSMFEASCLLLSQHFLIAHIAADAFPHAYALIEVGGSTGVYRVDIQRASGGTSTLAGTEGMVQQSLSNALTTVGWADSDVGDPAYGSVVAVMSQPKVIPTIWS